MAAFPSAMQQWFVAAQQVSMLRARAEQIWRCRNGLILWKNSVLLAQKAAL
ncbi:hypothetical protein R1T40_21340 (plasmid) [Tritonibacter scottomollicae]|uniref:Transposase n=1 Tax=Tritonibacter scottomollicae TaxID=483013 RepID=A0ABZ0HLF4_TRISK|nr:hypothetical protein [Tritonibacter scottomollicae]WOI35489.1 hypothetical protein R1T40_21340 [Tritonibacter scottomollicae]